MQQVEIRIEGCLDEKWAECFDGFEFTHNTAGKTILRGLIQDQAVLYGLIAKLRDLGAKLEAVYLDTLSAEDI